MTSYEKNLLPETIIPQHYDIHITPNSHLKEHEFTGMVKITFLNRAEEGDCRELSLHSSDIVIKKVVLNKRKTKGKIEYDEDEQLVKFIFDRPLKKGENVVLIEYRGHHRKDLMGFYHCFYKNKETTKKMVCTQFEPTSARRVFPCVDEPASKATFSLSLKVEKDLTALSNMPVISEKVKNKHKVIMFDITPIMSCYLLAIVVAELEHLESVTKSGVKIRTYTVPGHIEHSRFALETAVSSLEVFEEALGIAYPLPKLDCIAIPRFKAGAMENYGLVTFNHYCMLTRTDNIHKNKRIASVIAHELAHQWFGNLVTMKWWDELWLNEGFASWMEVFCIDKIYPELEMWSKFIPQKQFRAMNSDLTKRRHPVRAKIKHSKDADAHFDAITYSKGACIVHMMYSYMGEEPFFEGLRTYLKNFQYKVVTTEDLAQAWAESSGLGEEVLDMLIGWTDKSGFPLLTVTSIEQKGKDVTVRYEQKEFKSSNQEEATQTLLWKIPLTVCTEEGERSIPPLSDRAGNFTIANTTREFIKLNSKHAGYFITNYPNDFWLELAQMMHKDNTYFTVVDQVGLLQDLSFLVKHEHIEPHIALEFYSSFTDTSDTIVLQTLLPNLRIYLSVFRDNEKVSVQVKKFMAGLVKKPMLSCGFTERKNDTGKVKNLRKLLLRHVFACAVADRELLEESQMIFDRFLVDPESFFKMSLEHSVLDGLISLVLVIPGEKGEENFRRLFNFIQTTDNHGAKFRAFSSIGSTTGATNWDKVLLWALENCGAHDFFLVFRSVCHSKEGREHAWLFFMIRFDIICALLQADLNQSTTLEALLANHLRCIVTSLEEQQKVLEFLQLHEIFIVEEKHLRSLIRNIAPPTPQYLLTNEVFNFFDKF